MSDIFLKIDDGQSVKMVLRGEIFMYRSRWDEASRRFVTEQGEPNTYRINAIIQDSGKFVSKIYEFKSTVFKLLMKFDRSVKAASLGKKTFRDLKFILSRRGLGKATEWDLDVSPDELGPKLEQQINAVELKSLDPQRPNAGQPPPKPQSRTNDDELPF